MSGNRNTAHQHGWLTPYEAASQLDITANSLIALARSGHIPFVQLRDKPNLIFFEPTVINDLAKNAT